MIKAYAKAIAQLSDPALRRPLWLGLGISVLVFVLLWGGVAVLLTQTTVINIPWLDAIVDVLGGVATLVITWFLFPVVISATIGLFLDAVAAAVERRHYPGLPPAREQSVGEVILSSIKFLVVVVALNLVVLASLLVPPLFPFVFYTVNGYLLGREYFESVAFRRLDATQARAMRRAHRPKLFLTGLLAAFMLTIPFINLLAPIVVTAAMVHVFQSLRTSNPSA